MKVRQSYDVERDTSKDLNKSEILILKFGQKWEMSLQIN